METFYDTLQVKEDAPPEIIRAAYKALSSMFHPDKNPDDEAAASMMQRINDAYRILRDPDLRARYDESLKRMRAQAAPPQPPVDDDEPPATQPPPGELKKVKEKRSPSIWPVILAGATGAATLGAIGTGVGLAAYFWLSRKTNWMTAAAIATVLAIVSTGGLRVAFDEYSQSREVAQSQQPDAAHWARKGDSGAEGAGPWLQYAPQTTLPATDIDGRPCSQITELLGECMRQP